jgi:hypothetical protein
VATGNDAMSHYRGPSADEIANAIVKRLKEFCDKRRRNPGNLKHMGAHRFRAALDNFGFSQVGFARTIDRSDRSIRRWIAGMDPVPREVATPP